MADKSIQVLPVYIDRACAEVALEVIFVTKQIWTLYLNIKVLVFSHLHEKNAIKNLFYFGINGFLSKKKDFFLLKLHLQKY